MKNLIKNEQSGRSMVEMLGVLAIIGVLSVAGISGYSKAMAKFKITKTTDQISTMVANLRTIYAGQRNYKDLVTKTAIDLGSVPSEMLGGADDTINNAFNGAVTIGTISVGGVANLGFYVKYDRLSQDACSTLATSDWGSGSNSGLLAISINDSISDITKTTASTEKTFVAKDLPISPVDAAKQCTVTKDESAITWYYF